MVQQYNEPLFNVEVARGTLGHWPRSVHHSFVRLLLVCLTCRTGAVVRESADLQVALLLKTLLPVKSPLAHF